MRNTGTLDSNALLLSLFKGEANIQALKDSIVSALPAAPSCSSPHASWLSIRPPSVGTFCPFLLLPQCFRKAIHLEILSLGATETGGSWGSFSSEEKREK